MYVDDIKLLTKNEKELKTLIQTITIYSQDLGMEFGIEKCAMLIMRSGKREITEGIKLLNQKRIRTHEENEFSQYLGILEANTIKYVEKEEKIAYLKRSRKLLETKTVSGISSKGLNIWVVPLVRYLGPFLKWTREELRQMGQRTRKLMMKHKASHSGDEIDKLYVSKNEGGRASKLQHY